MTGRRPTVLVFAGLDPSGGAGVTADVLAIAANGAHALPVVTALTVQDHNRVQDVVAVDGTLLVRQAEALIAATTIDAVKLGIPGSAANARAIAGIILRLRAQQRTLPVVLDPVLASGHGDLLSRDDAIAALAPLLALASVVTPNLGEAAALDLRACPHVLCTGGHGAGPQVVNDWSAPHGTPRRAWHWPRLAGQFHGSGCTLAAALAARLAAGDAMEQALATAQAYVHAALEQAFAIGAGQRIPQRAPSRWPHHEKEAR